MNQDQVKEKLLQIRKDVEDFKVIFSGKKNKKVDGLYKPETREIILHNHNFKNDNSLIYTAIHEYAHHIQFTTSPVPVSTRAHTSAFRNILHELLIQAELLRIYYNVFKAEPEFINLTRQIRQKFLIRNGRLMKEFGNYLLKAYDLCLKYEVSFDDYMDRELLLQRSTAKTIMRCTEKKINPDIGFENMKIVANIKDPEKSRQAEEAFIQGTSPDTVKMRFKTAQEPESTLEVLLIKKKRIASTIEKLKLKLAEIEKRIAEAKK